MSIVRNVDRQAFGEYKEDLRQMDQCLESLEQGARQPHLAMEADIPADKKTRERTEGAATAVQAKHGDNFSVNRVYLDPRNSTSFGDDSLVGNGAAAPKSCLSPVEMRTPKATSGLLPTDKTSTATRTTLHQLLLWFFPTK